MEERKGEWEELRVTGDQLVSTVKRLVREGNVRRVIIKDDEGRTFLEIPLTVGVVGAMFLPIWAGLGAIAALVSGFTIVVEKSETAAAEPDELAHVT